MAKLPQGHSTEKTKIVVRPRLPIATPNPLPQNMAKLPPPTQDEPAPRPPLRRTLFPVCAVGYEYFEDLLSKSRRYRKWRQDKRKQEEIREKAKITQTAKPKNGVGKRIRKSLVFFKRPSMRIYAFLKLQLLSDKFIIM